MEKIEYCIGCEMKYKKRRNRATVRVVLCGDEVNLCKECSEEWIQLYEYKIIDTYGNSSPED